MLDTQWNTFENCPSTGYEAYMKHQYLDMLSEGYKLGR